jgi:hypothetical protein
MSKGYLVMAQGNYLDMAIALAESIKRTQSTVNNISIIVDCDVDVTEHSAVDNFIELPNDMSGTAEWKIHNRCQFYDLSPYDETVILDADMLFLTDVGHWWTDMSRYDLLLTKRVKTYRGEWVTDSPYRKTFRTNKLPDVYSAFTYFKKSDLAKTFFQLLTSIIQNWDVWSELYSFHHQQDRPSIDVAMAIAVKILDCESEVTSTRDYPTFTHMKSGCQGWKQYPEDWRRYLPYFIHGNNLKFGDYIQQGVLHYVSKDFANDQIMEIFK